jgi:colanic acid/amylovoran biosynthesis glycosyltransferase
LSYLKEGLAFVQHSIKAMNGDEEGTPVAILEASAAGLPVIATVHGGIPDIIEDGKTGFLVSEHDVDAMTDKMILLLKNKDLAIEMGKKGKERIEKYFRLEKHIENLDNLLADLINRHE